MKKEDNEKRLPIWEDGEFDLEEAQRLREQQKRDAAKTTDESMRAYCEKTKAEFDAITEAFE